MLKERRLAGLGRWVDSVEHGEVDRLKRKSTCYDVSTKISGSPLQCDLFDTEDFDGTGESRVASALRPFNTAKLNWTATWIPARAENCIDGI